MIFKRILFETRKFILGFLLNKFIIERESEGNAAALYINYLPGFHNVVYEK